MKKTMFMAAMVVAIFATSAMAQETCDISMPDEFMDIKLLKEKYAGKLCLFGGMNVETLISGSIDEITAEVSYAITYGAPGGGLVLPTET